MPANLMESVEEKASDELLQAQTQLWSHIFNYVDSMALKCAVELGIPDAIASCGPSATVPDLISALSLSPSKAPHMRRLMRMLTHSGIFACSHSGNGEENAYSLTPISELLLANEGARLSGFIRILLHPVVVDSFQTMSGWFRGDEATPFYMAHGCNVWDMTKRDPKFNEVLNEGMACDTQFLMDLVLKECGHVFRGIGSLMDVGGGTGAAAVAIAKAFPGVKCSVLDLPQVVDAIGDRVSGDVDFIAGDMFDHVPPANAVLLKWTLHACGNEECVKILQRCKEAIPSKEDGGKVIIIDLVVAENDCPDQKSLTTQLYCDIMTMVQAGGVERGEKLWRKLFMEAGFTDYKITPMGLRSIIEVYP